MIKKDDLIQENIELKARLDLAEKWMRREVANSIDRIDREKSTRSTRKSLTNMFESEWLDILTKRILAQFDDSLSNAPKYTIERLIDAEIYWQTLQRYPQMDALPIVLAYQKILDAWIEDRLIVPYRTKMQHIKIGHAIHSTDADITNIIQKWYTLSIGRLYQLLSLIRDGVDISPMTESLIAYWQKEIANTLAVLISDECFVPFSDLIALEVFSRKRHEGKVNYSDAEKIRGVMVDATSTKSFLEMIFSV
jgi:hypothetical protein